MPRAIWKGAISFGLVNIPIGLYTATESKDVQFHQFEKGSGKRIHYRRVAEGGNREVDWDDIVKGYELSKGEFVIVTPEELESVEPGKTKTIEISEFVDLAEIDPIFFEKAYYVAPDGQSAAKAYSLLQDALSETDRVGLGYFVMRTKQYLAAIRPSGNMLLLETMFFPDEIRDAGDISELPVRTRSNPREKEIAVHLIESLTVPWDPSRYKDSYRDRVLDLVRKKAKGQTITVEPEPEPEAARDLMEALQASVEALRSGRTGESKASGKPAGPDLRHLSKEELYEAAGKLDVKGRSKMTKSELAEAIEKAS